MNLAIVVNSKRYDEKILNKEIITDLAAKYKFSFDLYICEPNKIGELFSQLRLKSYNTFLVAGGDGTVRSAVQNLVGQRQSLAILPLGTFNYFARQFDYPTKIEETIKIIMNQKTKCVDVGVVNDNVFLNHSSIGFYSHVLKLREKHKNILGKNRLFKILFTAINFFKVLPIYKLSMKTKDTVQNYQTCFTFIGNNYHSTNLSKFGNRQTLSSGLLSVYILKCQTRWELFKILISVILNRFDQSTDVIQFTTNDLEIYCQSKQINVVIDGELIKLSSPLIYAINNKQLTMVVP